MITWYRRRLLSRPPSGIQRERGSIPMLMIVIIVGVAFTALLAPMVVTQANETTLQTTRVEALNAAQSGLDTATGLLRSTMRGPDKPFLAANAGDASKLPCGPITGQAASTSGGDYTVKIQYFVANPEGQDDAWIANPANQMSCIPGYGVYMKGTATSADTFIPSFALLTSSGTPKQTAGAVTQGRTLRSLYVFDTSNAIDTGIGGGVSMIAPSKLPTKYCMDASTSSSAAVGTDPVAGNQIWMRLCDDPLYPTKGQSFYFNKNFQWVLSRTVGDAASPAGLCMTVNQDGIWRSGAKVLVQPCLTNTSDPNFWKQQWHYDEHSRIRDSQPNWYSVYRCLKAEDPTPGSLWSNVPDPLVLRVCTDLDWTNSTIYQTFTAGSATGSGGSGWGTNQLVNYSSGLCLDLSHVRSPSAIISPGAGAPTTYPCSADNGTFAGGFQRWNGLGGIIELPSGSPWTVTTGGSTMQKPITSASPLLRWGSWSFKPYSADPSYNYFQNWCIISFGSLADGPAGSKQGSSPVDVGFSPCGDSVWQQKEWNYFGTKDASGHDLPYRDKYTIKDRMGNCLGLNPVPWKQETFSGGVVKSLNILQTKQCDGQLDQKWNADPEVIQSVVKNVTEQKFIPAATLKAVTP